MTGEEILTKIRSRIRATNVRFKKMTRNQKKVQIAKDVLLQLELGRITANSVYFESSKAMQLFNTLMEEEGGRERDFKEIMDQTPRCEVCGIGAVFVATIDRLDKLKLGAFNRSRYMPLAERELMVRYLSEDMKIFTDEELNLIEDSFEGSNMFCRSDTPREAMREVMEQIIQKKGTISYKSFGLNDEGNRLEKRQ